MQPDGFQHVIDCLAGRFRNGDLAECVPQRLEIEPAYGGSFETFRVVIVFRPQLVRCQIRCISFGNRDPGSDGVSAGDDDEVFAFCPDADFDAGRVWNHRAGDGSVLNVLLVELRASCATEAASQSAKHRFVFRGLVQHDGHLWNRRPLCDRQRHGNRQTMSFQVLQGLFDFRILLRSGHLSNPFKDLLHDANHARFVHGFISCCLLPCGLVLLHPVLPREEHRPGWNQLLHRSRFVVLRRRSCKCQCQTNAESSGKQSQKKL